MFSKVFHEISNHILFLSRGHTTFQAPEMGAVNISKLTCFGLRTG